MGQAHVKVEVRVKFEFEVRVEIEVVVKVRPLVWWSHQMKLILDSVQVGVRVQVGVSLLFLVGWEGGGYVCGLLGVLYEIKAISAFN